MVLLSTIPSNGASLSGNISAFDLSASSIFILGAGYTTIAQNCNQPEILYQQPDCYKAKDLIINAGLEPEKKCYIESVSLNGKPLKSLSITQDDISKGAQLDFKLSSKKSPKWIK